MNADAFRHIYDYHFSENRKLWDLYVMNLPEEQFLQTIPYSIGSVRNQVVHLMSVDNGWFGDLSHQDFLEGVDLDNLNDRAAIRAEWDKVEKHMGDYLATLRDDMLFTKPLSGEDENLVLWQILLHVMNHGTDHRAQLLRLLHDFGLATTAQDYVFHLY